MESNGRWDVFISYKTSDRKKVSFLVEKLVEHGLKVWFDVYELKPSDSIVDKIDAGIKGSRTAIIAIGPDGSGPWQELEKKGIAHEFLVRGRPVIPVWLPDSKPNTREIPFYLRDLIIVDCYGGFTQERIEELVKIISKQPPASPEPIHGTFKSIEKLSIRLHEFSLNADSIETEYVKRVIDLVTKVIYASLGALFVAVYRYREESIEDNSRPRRTLSVFKEYHSLEFDKRVGLYELDKSNPGLFSYVYKFGEAVWFDELLKKTAHNIPEDKSREIIDRLENLVTKGLIPKENVDPEIAWPHKVRVFNKTDCIVTIPLVHDVNRIAVDGEFSRRRREILGVFNIEFGKERYINQQWFEVLQRCADAFADLFWTLDNTITNRDDTRKAADHFYNYVSHTFHSVF